MGKNKNRSNDSDDEVAVINPRKQGKKQAEKTVDDDEYNPFSSNYSAVKAHAVNEPEDEEKDSDFNVEDKPIKQHKKSAPKKSRVVKKSKEESEDSEESEKSESDQEDAAEDLSVQYNPFSSNYKPTTSVPKPATPVEVVYTPKIFSEDLESEIPAMKHELKESFDYVTDLLESIDHNHSDYSTIKNIKKAIKVKHSELKAYQTDPSSIQDLGAFLSSCDKLCFECHQFTQEGLLQENQETSFKSDDAQSDSDDAYGTDSYTSSTSRRNKANVIDYSSDEEYEFASKLVQFKRQCAKEVDALILNNTDGHTSSAHVPLAPKAQASIPIPVEAGDIIAFTWKEDKHSRLLFRALLTLPNSNTVQQEVVPLQVRIDSYQCIYEIPVNGVLRLGWDNSLSVRKSKDVSVWVRKFRGVDGQIVLEENERRQEAIRNMELEQLNKGAYEGGELTCKFASRIQTVDGVKYVCHCDWEGIMNSIHISWDVSYPYKQWYAWYCDLNAKYNDHVSRLPPFTGTALITTQAVIDERLSKINEFLQSLLNDRFLMNTIEVNSWLKWSENIRRAKKQAYEELKKKHMQEDDSHSPLPLQPILKQTQTQPAKATPPPPPPEDCFDPLSYLCN